MTDRDPASFISSKLRKLDPYLPQSAEAAGCIRMDANESPISLPESVRTEIAEKVRGVEFNRYPDPLAGGACAAFAARYGVSPGLVTAGNGSDELISVILNAFVDRGGKVLMTEPDFSMYRFYCRSYECTPVVLGKAGDLRFDPEDILRLAEEEKVQMIIFSNPCNPTGQGLPRDEVLRIVDGAGCTVVVDEAYMDFWDQSVLDAAAERPNLILLKTCSKIGFAAARIGFAVANPVLTGYLRAAKSPYNVNALTQAAAECFLRDRAWISDTVESIRRSRETLYDAFKQLEKEFPGRLSAYPSHTNFVLVRLPDARALHAALLRDRVAVRLFGEGLLRITAGAPEENGALLAALRRYLEQPARA